TTYVDALTKNSEVFGEPAANIAEQFRDRPESMALFKPALFTGKARAFVNFFWNTGIAYNFILDMTETNNLDTEINFLKSLDTQTRTLGVKAGVDRQRENTRTFTITDDFKTLI